MNKNSYFITLLALSVIGIGTVTVMRLFNGISDTAYPILTCIIGLGPMGVWHWFLHESDEAVQSQIDTVYFFGFLLTLMTLMSAVFLLVLSDDLDAGQKVFTIGVQFAVGLLSTGYGLFARVILTNRRVVGSSEEAVGQYLDQMQRLVFRMNEAVDGFVRLESSVIENAEKGAEKIANSAVTMVDSSVRAPLDKLGEAVRKLTSDFNHLDESEIIKTLNRSFGRANASVSGMTKSIDGLDLKLKDDTLPIRELSTLMAGLSQAVNDVKTEMGDLKAETGQVTDASKRLRQEYAEFSDATGTLVADISELNLDSVSESFQTFGKHVGGLTESIQSIRQEVDRLSEGIPIAESNVDDVLNKLKGVGETATSFVGFIKSFETDLEKLQTLGGAADKLSNQFENFSNSYEGGIESHNDKRELLITHLDELTKDLDESTNLLGTAMTGLAKSIRSASEELGGK